MYIHVYAHQGYIIIKELFNYNKIILWGYINCTDIPVRVTIKYYNVLVVMHSCMYVYYYSLKINNNIIAYIHECINT